MDPTITGTAKSGTENFKPLRQTVVTFQWPIVCSTLYMDFNILSILDTDSPVGAEIFFSQWHNVGNRSESDDLRGVDLSHRQ